MGPLAGAFGNLCFGERSKAGVFTVESYTHHSVQPFEFCPGRLVSVKHDGQRVSELESYEGFDCGLEKCEAWMSGGASKVSHGVRREESQGGMCGENPSEIGVLEPISN
jgi:hypothetical protein